MPRHGRADGAAVPCSTSPSTAARRSRSARAGSPTPRRGPLRSHEWSRLLTGRDASGVYGIQMFSIRREQGRLAELAPVIRLLAGPSDAGPGGPGSPRCSSSWAWRPRRGASSRASRPTGSTPSAPRCGSPSLDVPDGRGGGARRRGDGRAPLPRAGAARRRERDDRPRGRLLRGRRPLPRHARRDARRVGARRARTSSAPWSSTGAWARAPGSPTRGYEYGRMLRAARRRPPRPRRRAARRGRGRSPSASACRGCSRRIRGLGASAAGDARCPTACRTARWRSSSSSRRASATARSARRCSSASTPPPTTSAASCARRGCANRTEAASYAHRQGLAGA